MYTGGGSCWPPYHKMFVFYLSVKKLGTNIPERVVREDALEG